MLEKLVLQSFQAHRKLVITFDPHLTTIVGNSDVGKSTVIRALRWLCTNQIEPNAEAAIHWDYEGTRVRLIVDGHSITRSRIKGDNRYTLDGAVFKAFGASVPDRISDLLNIGDENFQQQLDQHFWFADTPGQVSKALNRIVNLEVIDRTQANIAADLRKARTVVEVSEQRLAEARAAKKELRYVPYLSDQLREVEELEQWVDDARSQIELLKDAVTESKRLELTQQKAAYCAKIGADLLDVQDRLIEAQAEQAHLGGTLETIKQHQIHHNRLTKELNAAKKELAKWQKCPTCGSPIRS